MATLQLSEDVTNTVDQGMHAHHRSMFAASML